MTQALPLGDYHLVSPASVRRPVYGYSEYYQGPQYWDSRRPESAETKYTIERLHQLERQAWAQAQIIRKQSTMLEAMSRDPRGAYNYASFARARPMYESRASKADPRLTEKRAQAKQFKTFIRTHFTVRAAFRFVEHFLTGEAKRKFNADTKSYLDQFSEELKRPKSALPMDKKSVPAGAAGSIIKSEGQKEFLEIATRHLRLVVEGIKSHPRYVNLAENKDHEKSIEASMSDNQEGRICLSRLMIYAITAFGIQGKTRLHQIANLLQEMQFNLEQDPDLVRAILAEAEARAKNYQQFCHAVSSKIPEAAGVNDNAAVAAAAAAAAAAATAEDNSDKRSEKSVDEISDALNHVVLHTDSETK